MKYIVKNSKNSEIEKLIEYKLETIFAYAKELPENEIVKIQNYVNNQVPKDISFYKSIYIKNEMRGCFLVKPFKDGVIIDEIYLEESARNHGIGTELIMGAVSKTQLVYLYVYKKNTKAIRLYEKMNFCIMEDVGERFLMKHKTINHVSN